MEVCQRLSDVQQKQLVSSWKMLGVYYLAVGTNNGFDIEIS